MRRAVLGTILVLAVVLSASPAFAVPTANFQGSCLGFSKNCDFDASKPASNPSACAGGAFIIQYDWTLTNPSATKTGNPITHTFNSTTASVTLKITCSDGREATITRSVCFSGGSGCIQPDQGYN
jgi:hypothetical protein